MKIPPKKKVHEAEFATEQFWAVPPDSSEGNHADCALLSRQRILRYFAFVVFCISSIVYFLYLGITIQGHPERVLKVNPFARALIFTKNGFSGVFWDEK